MLVAGFFRLPKDIPKPLWRYPLSYMGFDMYALQVSIAPYLTKINTIYSILID
jgi:hypothetical protein